MIQHTNKVRINTIFTMWPSNYWLPTITKHLNEKQTTKHGDEKRITILFNGIMSKCKTIMVWQAPNALD